MKLEKLGSSFALTKEYVAAPKIIKSAWSLAKSFLPDHLPLPKTGFFRSFLLVIYQAANWPMIPITMAYFYHRIHGLAALDKIGSSTEDSAEAWVHFLAGKATILSETTDDFSATVEADYPVTIDHLINQEFTWQKWSGILSWLFPGSSLQVLGSSQPGLFLGHGLLSADAHDVRLLEPLIRKIFAAYGLTENADGTINFSSPPVRTGDEQVTDLTRQLGDITKIMQSLTVLLDVLPHSEALDTFIAHSADFIIERCEKINPFTETNVVEKHGWIAVLHQFPHAKRSFENVVQPLRAGIAGASVNVNAYSDPNQARMALLNGVAYLETDQHLRLYTVSIFEYAVARDTTTLYPFFEKIFPEPHVSFDGEDPFVAQLLDDELGCENYSKCACHLLLRMGINRNALDVKQAIARLSKEKQERCFNLFKNLSFFCGSPRIAAAINDGKASKEFLALQKIAEDFCQKVAFGAGQLPPEFENHPAMATIRARMATPKDRKEPSFATADEQTPWSDPTLMTKAMALRILNLPDHATMQEIKKAFKVLAVQWHPDKNPGDERSTMMMQRLNVAYKFLTK